MPASSPTWRSPRTAADSLGLQRFASRGVFARRSGASLPRRNSPAAAASHRPGGSQPATPTRRGAVRAATPPRFARAFGAGANSRPSTAPSLRAPGSMPGLFTYA